MVNAAASDAVSLPAVPAKKSTVRRTRRRPDLLSVACAALAVIVVGAAGAVGVVQAANASPAASVVQVLQSDEAAIENSAQALAGAHERLSVLIETSSADAAALAAAIEDTRYAPDPAEVVRGFEEPERMPISDETATTTFLDQSAAYRAALVEVVLPALPEPYERGDVDTDSLTEVGAAIDQAQVALTALDGATAEMRAARTTVEDLIAAYEQQRATFAATFSGRSTQILEEAPDAASERRDAVSTAAAQIVSTSLTGADGIAGLAIFRDAVVAVLDQQARIDVEAEAQAERERERADNGNSGNDGQGTDPGSGTETPPPVEPTDPEIPPEDEVPVE